MRLTQAGCRQRQQQVAAALTHRGLRGAVLSRRDHVLYLTGFLCGRHHAAALYIDASARVWLAGAGVPADTAVDEVIPYEPARHATMHSQQAEAVAAALAAVVPRGVPLGTDAGGGSGCACALAGADASDVTGDLVRLRQRKLPDEVDAIRAAVRVTEALYAAARDVVQPGVDEIEVLAQLRAVGTRAAGEDLEHFGNDFQANSPGGPARPRPMQAGELYILDAGPSLHGYFADNCRTFAVGRQPTDAQARAWEDLDALFPRLEAAVAPGVPAASVFRLADEYLRERGYAGLVHHLGHGIGLAPHEAPQLNPAYDAVFAVGDVFTMEPGVYGPELRAGIRLEEDYLLAEDGLVRLTSFPRSLV